MTSLLTLLLSATTLAPAAEPPAYKLETAFAQSIEANLTYESHTPNLVAREWILFGARLVDLPGQVKTSSTMEPGGREARELSELRRPLWVGRVPADTPEHAKSIALFITIKADLLSRHLVELRPGDKRPHAPALGDKERQASLLSHGMIDLKDAQFQQWLDTHELRRGKNESDLDCARRTFLVIRKNFTYEYKAIMDRRTGLVCKLGRSDCGGLSSLFVATLRTNKIPARMLAGRWAQSDRKGAKLEGVEYHQWHVKSEFFAEGIGWVPVDMSAAVTQRGGKELAYFGHDHGDFVVFHLDADFEVDTIHFGKAKLTWLQTPTWWVIGDGKVEPIKSTQDWQVRSKKK